MPNIYGYGQAAIRRQQYTSFEKDLARNRSDSNDSRVKKSSSKLESPLKRSVDIDLQNLKLPNSGYHQSDEKVRDSFEGLFNQNSALKRKYDNVDDIRGQLNILSTLM